MSARPAKIRIVHRPMALDDANISPDVPDRVRTEAITGVLEDLCREITARGWNQHHQLGFLYQRLRTPVGGELEQLGVSAAVLEYSPLAGGEVFSQVERPHHVLLHLVESMRRDLDYISSLVPPDLIAVVMATEAWMVTESPEQLADPVRKAKMAEARRKRELHLHPDRKEVRFLVAVDVDYVRYAVNQVRGEAPHHLVGMGTSSAGLQGEVPNALEYLVWVINGRDPGEWNEWWRKHYDYRSEEDKD